MRLSHQDPGFKPENLWVGLTVMPQAQYPDVASRARFAEQMTSALRATPGVQEVAISGGFPLFNGGARDALHARGWQRSARRGTQRRALQ